ncbi:MAG: YihY family inner membrane protein [Proteobacteria bacterium]|nr:YihY family inner membrane protein [Pseudomonadota bacterium]
MKLLFLQILAKIRATVFGAFIQLIGRILRILWQIFLDRKLPALAQALAYTTILSLVPILAMFFAVLGSVTQDLAVKDNIREFISTYFFPEHAISIFEKLEELASGSFTLGVIGVPAVFLAGVFLYVKVDSSINQIWVSRIERKWFKNSLAFFMTLFFGPMILVLVFTIPPYLQSLPYYQELLALPAVSNLVTHLMPIAIATTGLLVLYIYIPASPVMVPAALLGAFLAAILIQASNVLLSTYLKYFAGYDLIYGSLAMIPILLIWIFVIWLVVLLGAALTFIFQYHHTTGYLVMGEAENDESLLCSALQVLVYICQSFYHRHSAPDFDQIQLMLGIRRKRLSHILKTMRAEGLITAFVGSSSDGIKNTRYQPGFVPENMKLNHMVPLFYKSREPIVFGQQLNQLLMNLEVHPGFFDGHATMQSLIEKPQYYLDLFHSGRASETKPTSDLTNRQSSFPIKKEDSIESTHS